MSKMRAPNIGSELMLTSTKQRAKQHKTNKKNKNIKAFNEGWDHMDGCHDYLTFDQRSHSNCITGSSNKDEFTQVAVGGYWRKIGIIECFPWNGIL
jgi:hypothetical protein